MLKLHVAVTQDRGEEIERVTRGQSSTDDVTTNLWLSERCKRITSSVAGTIARHRNTTKVASLVRTLLYGTFQGNTATQYGHDQEVVTHHEDLRT